MRVDKLFVIVACSTSLVSGLGCDSRSTAELEAARAELSSARADLSSARADLERSAERLNDATIELKASREALDMLVETANAFSAGALDDINSIDAVDDPEQACTVDACKVDRDAVRKLRDNPATLARQARIVPSLEDGVAKGFKIYGIRSASLPKLFGLKNGDLLTAINGSSIITLDDAMAAYTAHREDEKFVINIVRKARPLTLKVELVEGGESPTLR